jgi:hypothetical protein
VVVPSDPVLQPSASYSVTIRVELSCRPGTLGRVATAIGDVGGDIDEIQIIHTGADSVVRDLTVACRDERHGESVAQRISTLDGVQVLGVTDRTFDLHLGGKIEVRGRVPVRGPGDLSMLYTPGVGRVSQPLDGGVAPGNSASIGEFDTGGAAQAPRGLRPNMVVRSRWRSCTWPTGVGSYGNGDVIGLWCALDDRHTTLRSLPGFSRLPGSSWRFQARMRAMLFTCPPSSST